MARVHKLPTAVKPPKLKQTLHKIHLGLTIISLSIQGLLVYLLLK